jgi:ATP-dependent Clp protease protease subunit
MSVIPFVIDRDGHGERSYDIYSRLLKERIIFLGGPIDDQVANSIVAQMLYLMSVNKNQDIHLYINSPGGSITSGFAILDTMQFIPCDVATYCIGQCASMGAFLLAAGTKGKRHALRSSRIMIHQPSGGAEGMASDIAIQAKEIDRLKKYLNERLSSFTGKDVRTITRDTDRDLFMNAEDAKEYGLIDSVVDKLKA